MTPAEAAADPSTWGERKPNRLRVWEEHRYAYDAWGNCVEKKSGPHSVRSFEWDAAHQLSRAKVIRQQGRFLHSEHWGYDYDPFGRRIAKYRLDPTNRGRCRPWLDSGTTHFSWDGNRLLLERQGDQQTLYLYEPNTFVPLALVRSEEKSPEKTEQDGFPLPLEWLALKDSHPQQWDATVGVLQRKFDAKHNRDKPAAEDIPKSPVEVFYVHADHLGTPRELTDVAGHIVWAAAYKAWGSTAKIERPGRLVTHTVGNTQTQRWEEQSGPIEQNLRFQGQYFDLETGLHYNRFRYYDPDCGRFVSQDPIGLAGGTNNYQYAPNPMGWVDPLGLAVEGTIGGHAEIKGGGNQAHELIRHKALELMGCTKGNQRHTKNPSIAVTQNRHTGADNPTAIHKNESVLAAEYLGMPSRNQFEFGEDGMPSKRQMDVWQGAVRMSGITAAKAKELRRQADKFLKDVCAKICKC